MDFVRRWTEKTEISTGRFIEWLEITASKLYDWQERYGKVNEHNGWVPPDDAGSRPVYERWHIDVSYLNIGGTFYYLLSAKSYCIQSRRQFSS